MTDELTLSKTVESAVSSASGGVSLLVELCTDAPPIAFHFLVCALVSSGASVLVTGASRILALYTYDWMSSRTRQKKEM